LDIDYNQKTINLDAETVCYKLQKGLSKKDSELSFQGTNSKILHLPKSGHSCWMNIKYCDKNFENQPTIFVDGAPMAIRNVQCMVKLVKFLEETGQKPTKEFNTERWVDLTKIYRDSRDLVIVEDYFGQEVVIKNKVIDTVSFVDELNFPLSSTDNLFMMDTNNISFNQYGCGQLVLGDKEISLIQLEKESDGSLIFVDKIQRNLTKLGKNHKIDLVQLLNAIEGIELAKMQVFDAPVIHFEMSQRDGHSLTLHNPITGERVVNHTSNMMVDVKSLLQKGGKLNFGDVRCKLNNIEIQSGQIVVSDEENRVWGKYSDMFICMEDFYCNNTKKTANLGKGHNTFEVTSTDDHIVKVLIKTPKETRARYSMSMSMMSGVSYDPGAYDGGYKAQRPNLPIRPNSYYLLSSSLATDESHNALLKVAGKENRINHVKLIDQKTVVDYESKQNEFKGTTLLNLSSFVYDEETLTLEMKNKEQIATMMSVPTKKNNIKMGNASGNDENVDLKNIWINLKKIWDKKTETFLLP
jgi:hypothetical protein